MADSDYHLNVLYSLVTQLEQADSTRFCLLQKTLLNLLRRQNGEFFRIHNSATSEEIIYVEHNNLYFPHCTQVNGLSVINLVEVCHSDIPVHVHLFNTSVKLFLNPAGILQKQSRVVDCRTRVDINLFDKFMVSRQN